MIIVTGRRKSIVVSSEDIEWISGKGANVKDWLEKYTGSSEYIDEGLPDLMGRSLRTAVYFNSNHAHDQVTRRLVSGVLCFVGSTTIIWNSKRQGNIERCRYSTEFCTGWVATEEAIALWYYMLRSLGVPVKGVTALFAYNLGIIISCTNPELKKKSRSLTTSCGKVYRSVLSTP